MASTAHAHTPGPWSLDADGPSAFYITTTPGNPHEGEIAVIYKVRPHDAPNARLIAAAPDLYEALHEGLAAIDAAYAACPVNSSPRSVEQCPKCGANDSQNCGKWVSAAGRMEKLARAALSKAESGQ